jgi:phospholipid/cholesterol/gamma-HCH transport system permease protein
MPCIQTFSHPDEGTLVIHLSGRCTFTEGLPQLSDIRNEIEPGSSIGRIFLEGEHITDWDTGLLTFLIKVINLCAEHHIDVDKERLPEGVKRLINLAVAVPERKGARRESRTESLLARLGNTAFGLWRDLVEMITFIGESALAFIKFFTGGARFRGSDFMYLIQDCGAQALSIVTLISVLVGIIMAFVGAVQLKMFGAQIYVANLVGLAMTREMGAMMTGIIMAGRTGAAYAAQLGTMQVNEEIDALRTMGISPMEFLVLPRMVALVFMMPLLCIYADFLGMMGGMMVGIGMLDLSPTQYVIQTKEAITLNDFFIGVFKSAVFGILVALSGSLRGMQCGRSSLAVGSAATSAVVTGIVFIIVSDSVITIICSILGI